MGAGWLYLNLEKAEDSRAYFERSLVYSQETGSADGIAYAIHGLGCVAHERKDFETAQRLLEEGLRIRRGLGTAHRITWSLFHLACLWVERGDLGRARELLEEAARLGQEIDDPWCQAPVLLCLGRVTYAMGRKAEARGLAVAALRRYEDLRHGLGVQESLVVLGDIAQVEGDLGRAEECYRRALQQYLRTGERYGLRACLEGWAELEGARGRPERAALLCGAATSVPDRWRGWHGGSAGPLLETGRLDRLRDALQRELGEERFQAAFDEGRGMPTGEAVSLAVAADGTGCGALSPPRYSPPL